MTVVATDAAARAHGRPARGHYAVAALLLASATLLAHVWSLGDGLALDDHWHYHSFRASGWGPRDLLDATTIDTRDHVQLWWQEKPVRFVYGRPVAVLLLKTIYAVTGGSAGAAHGVSLVLHFAAALLLYQLCRKLTRSTWWALVGGLAFAVYPHTVYAVGWLAAQNIVLQTGLMLAALLAYVRASGLVLAADDGGRRQVSALRVAPFVLAVVLWVVALFSRENAIMLPAILVAFDLAYGGWRQVWRRIPAYLVLAVLGLAFLIWRLRYLYEPMPEVYVRSSDAAGYGLWCVAKLLHYLSTALIPAPMTVGPTGRFHPFSEIPRDMALMIAIVVGISVVYVAAARRVRGFWIWPAWILLAILPVIPVLATPHSGYLCGVGVAVGLALAGSCVVRSDRRRWRVTARVLALLILLVYAGSMKVGRLLWMGSVYSEQFTMMGLRADPPPESTQDIFFINLPFTGIYAKRCLAEQEGLRIDELRCHVLTFAPDIMRMDARCALVQTDAHAFTLELADERYFSNLLGRFLIAGFREPCPFRNGQRFDAGEYVVEILEADDAGVRKLAFRFDKPLSDPRYCFYLSSHECGALRVDFTETHSPTPLPAPPRVADDILRAAGEVLAGDAAAAATIFAALTSDDVAIRATAEDVLRKHAAVVATSLAAPVQDRLAGDGALSAHADELWTWWQQRVSDRELGFVLRDRPALRRLRHRRDEVLRGRRLIGRYIRTDLFLSGEPFPGLDPHAATCDR